MIKKKHDKIIDFLRELRNSGCNVEDMYLNGSCLNLYKILKVLYPESEPFYDPIVGHIVTKIDDKYYDIRGVSYKKSHFLPYNHSSLGWTRKKFVRSYVHMSKKTNPYCFQ